MTRHNYRSDIALKESFYRRDEAGGVVEIPIPEDVDFRLTYHADGPCVFSASRIGGAYENCQPEGASSLVVFIPLSRVDLGTGTLARKLVVTRPDPRFKKGSYEICIPAETGITLWDGPTDAGDVEISSLDFYQTAVHAIYADKAGDADKWDGAQFADYLDQPVRRGDRVRFAGVTAPELRSPDYAEGSTLAGGRGMRFYTDENGDSVGVVDRLEVRKEVHFNAAVINQQEFRLGETVFSRGGCSITRVEERGSAWRCYYDNRGGKRFAGVVIGDQIRCQRYDASYGATLKYYWRPCVGVGEDYIEISRTEGDGTGTPAEGDDAVQFGNLTDKTRQSAMLVDAATGKYVHFARIGTPITLSDGSASGAYSLEERAEIILGYDAEEGHSFAQIIGSAYIGARNPEDGYMVCRPDGKGGYEMLFNGKISVGSSGLENLTEWRDKQGQIDNAVKDSADAKDTVDNLELGGQNLVSNLRKNWQHATLDYSDGSTADSNYNAVTDFVAIQEGIRTLSVYYEVLKTLGEGVGLGYVVLCFYGSSKAHLPDAGIDTGWNSGMAAAAAVSVPAGAKYFRLKIGCSHPHTVYEGVGELWRAMVSPGSKPSAWQPSVGDQSDSIEFGSPNLASNLPANYSPGAIDYATGGIDSSVASLNVHSDYIALQSGVRHIAFYTETLSTPPNTSGAFGYVKLCFYKADKSHISGTGIFGGAYTGMATATVKAVPADAAYFRFSLGYPYAVWPDAIGHNVRIMVSPSNKAAAWQPSAEDQRDSVQVGAVNLIDGSSEMIVPQGPGPSNYKDWPAGKVSADEELAISVQDIRLLAGDTPEGYNVQLWNSGVTASISNMLTFKGSGPHTGVFRVRTADANARLVLYSGISGSAANKSAAYVQLALVRGNRPMLSWQMSPQDQFDSVQVGGVNYCDDSERKLAGSKYGIPIPDELRASLKVGDWLMIQSEYTSTNKFLCSITFGTSELGSWGNPTGEGKWSTNFYARQIKTAEELAGSIKFNFYVSNEAGTSRRRFFGAGNKPVSWRLSAKDQFDSIQIGAVNLLDGGAAEKSDSEYLYYANLAPIIDAHGIADYTVSFDVKTNKAGKGVVYFDDRSQEKLKYVFEPKNKEIDGTTSWARHSITVRPKLNNASAAEAPVCFYFTYGTGVIPTVRNVKVEKGTKATDFAPSPADEAAARERGKIFVRGVTYNQPGSEPEKAPIVEVGGKRLAPLPGSWRGLTTVAVDRISLEVLYAKRYDLYSGATNWEANASALAADLEALTDRAIVMIVSYDSWTPSPALVSTLHSFGASIELPMNGRTPYALIGMKGIGKGNGLERIEPAATATAPYADISTTVIGGMPIGISASTYVNRTLDAINDDATFDRVEKQAIRTQWEAISGVANTTGAGSSGSYYRTKQQMSALEVPADSIDARFVELRSYLDSLALYTDSDVTPFVRTTMAAKFRDYYDAEDIALRDVREAVTGYAKRRFFDLSTLDQDTYYPVVMNVNSLTTRCDIYVCSDSPSGTPGWSTHASKKFTCHCEWSTMSSNWGWSTVNRYVTAFEYRYADVTPIGSIGQLTASSMEYIYLRGGGRYMVKASRCAGMELITAQKTFANNEKIAPAASVTEPVVDIDDVKSKVVSYEYLKETFRDQSIGIGSGVVLAGAVVTADGDIVRSGITSGRDDLPFIFAELPDDQDMSRAGFVLQRNAFTRWRDGDNYVMIAPGNWFEFGVFSNGAPKRSMGITPRTFAPAAGDDPFAELLSAAGKPATSMTVSGLSRSSGELWGVGVYLTLNGVVCSGISINGPGSIVVPPISVSGTYQSSSPTGGGTLSQRTTITTYLVNRASGERKVVGTGSTTTASATAAGKTFSVDPGVYDVEISASYDLSWSALIGGGNAPGFKGSIMSTVATLTYQYSSGEARSDIYGNGQFWVRAVDHYYGEFVTPTRSVMQMRCGAGGFMVDERGPRKWNDALKAWIAM